MSFTSAFIQAFFQSIYNKMIIKQFSEDQIKPAAKLCRQNLENDIMPDFLLKEKTFGDPDFDPELTLVGYNEDSETPVAFIQAVIRKRDNGKVAYIKLLCVDSNERRKGWGTKLFKEISKKIFEIGANKIRVGESYPNYFMPGVDPFYTEAVCFFENNGFKKFGDTSNLSVDLLANDFSSADDEKKLLQKKITVRRAAASDKEKVLKWIDKVFPVWNAEVSESFSHDKPAIFIAESGGKIKGFSVHEVNNKGTGWFGPMGTDDSARGKGIGKVLLLKSLQDLKDMGFVKAIIPWVGPIPFYADNCNAKVDRVFWRYEKLI